VCSSIRDSCVFMFSLSAMSSSTMKSSRAPTMRPSVPTPMKDGFLSIRLGRSRYHESCAHPRFLFGRTPGKICWKTGENSTTSRTAIDRFAASGPDAQT
jgi:hypothetical protein